MAEGRINLRDELRAHKFEFDLLQKIPCSKQENKEYKKLLKDGGTLPEGIYAYEYSDGEVSTTEFYRIYEADLTESEIREYLTYKQMSILRTIKNCVVFFTALTIIGMAACFFLMMTIF